MQISGLANQRFFEKVGHFWWLRIFPTYQHTQNLDANIWAGKPTFFGSSMSILVVENHSYYYPILVYILSSILRTSMQIFGLANHSMVAVKKNIFKWLKVTCVYRLNKLQCYFHFTNTSPLFILQMFLGRLLLSAGLQSVLLNAIVRSA